MTGFLPRKAFSVVEGINRPADKSMGPYTLPHRVTARFKPYVSANARDNKYMAALLAPYTDCAWRAPASVTRFRSCSPYAFPVEATTTFSMPRATQAFNTFTVPSTFTRSV